MRRTPELDDFYRTRVECVDTSGIVFTSRGLLCSVGVSADGANSGATIYDGENAKGRRIAYIPALAETLSPWLLQRPLYCERGLYVAVDNANARVSVEYAPIPQKLSE